MRGMFDVLIVGAGHAGAQAAIALRQQKFTGSIGLVGDEPYPPYERPPLNKEYLSGAREFERILIRPQSYWTERHVTLLMNRRVVAIDALCKTAKFDDGCEVAFGKVIWAAGGRARKLSCAGSHLRGVHSIRTRGDVDHLREELVAANHVVIVGGGYIGLEAAAVFRKMGLGVTLIETLDRVLARVSAEPVSRFFEREHRSHGVQILLSTVAESIKGNHGRVVGVKLANGGVIAADIVVVGIGIIPNVEELAAAGARAENGVAVDEFCRTTLDDIYAVGDCAQHLNRFAAGRAIRLESVQNASDMALAVAKSITGIPEPYRSLPWFWSNQYDLRLQTSGLTVVHDKFILRGDPASRSFTTVYTRAGRVVAVDCVNSPRDYVESRALILSGAKVDAAQLADPSVPLKSLAFVSSSCAE
jgi:3-phenylpropionate/trans-cinnamate dioxygenase ferredoxin reductase component